MTDGPSLADALAELPMATDQAVSAVLELYAAVRQCRRLGATYDQLVAATGMARGTVQNVVAGQLPRFAVDGA